MSDTTPIRTVTPCPYCGAAAVVRLSDDWREQARAGVAIPIVGCGNPWHYANLQPIAPAEGLREHPGQHNFHALCRICGEPGYINLSLVAGDEAVQIVKRAALEGADRG